MVCYQRHASATERCDPPRCASRIGVRRILVLALVLAAHRAHATHEFGPWETVSDRDGIKLQARSEKTTGVVETLASVTLSCTTDALWKAIITPDTFVKLMPKTTECRPLEDHPAADGREGFLYMYQRLHGSPTSDRDYTLKVQWTMKDGEGGHAYSRSWYVENDKGPAPIDGVVRVLINEGSWALTPTGDGRTLFVYQNYLEIGGNLWTRLGNNAAKDAARGFLENLKTKFPDAPR